MINKTKTSLQFILAGALFVSFAVTGCNNEGDSKEATKDTVATEKSMEAAPVAPATTDTTKKDTASTRPTPTGN